MIDARNASDALKHFRPRDAAFEGVARAIWDEREDLRALYGDPSSLEFAKWLSVDAPLELPSGSMDLCLRSRSSRSSRNSTPS